MSAAHDDKALMVQYRDGDIGAFEQLYSRHKGPLYRYLLRQCRNPDIAAELFQEVWANVIRARRKYRPTAKFATYMYQIAHNCFVDYLRRQARQPRVTDATVADQAGAVHCEPDARAAEIETAARLEQALLALPREQREAFLLREEAGLSVEQIGIATGVGRETAKSRLRYAATRLRESLADLIEEVK